MFFRLTIHRVILAITLVTSSLIFPNQAFAVVSVPSAVESLVVSQVSVHSVGLSWNAPVWSPDSVTDYRIEYKKPGMTDWTPFSHATSTQTTISITGLEADSAYSFRVTPIYGADLGSVRTLGIKQVAVGMSHACALTDTGEVYCWGDNTFGQLGNSDATVASSSVPLKVANLQALYITSGRDHVCAQLVDNSLKCWGSNSNGQLGTGDTSYSSSASPRQVTGITSASSVVAGAMHTCAIADGGSVKCWGTGAKFRLGIASSYGQADVSTPTAVAGLVGASVKQISAGTSQTCALLTTGGVNCWGDNATGQLGTGATSSATPSPKPVSGIDGVVASAVQISMGSQHACAVLSDGTAKCWGAGASGRLGNATTTNASTPAFVKASGATLTGIRTVAAGFESSCAIVNSGSVYCWGNNASGQLGTGNLTSQSQATANSITNAVSLAADLGSNSTGTGHNCAVLSDASVKCWGSGTNYVLGNGSTTSSSTPVAATVGGPISVTTSVSAPDAPTWNPPISQVRAIELSWNAPQNNGREISGYTVKFFGGNRDGQTACTTTPSVTSCTVSGLSATAQYQFALTATNSVGTSDTANSEVLQSVSSGSNGNLTWQDNGSNILITGCLANCESITIPDSVAGYLVTQISSNALADPTIKSVNFPSNLTSLPATGFGTNKLPLSAPSNISPKVSGSSVVGGLLSVSGTSWLSSATKQYAWYRNGQPIAGATKNTYQPTVADYGQMISATVTLRKTGYVSITVESSEQQIAAGSIPLAATPGLIGFWRVGQTLSAKVGTWTNGTSFTYQWKINGLPIPEATSASYTLNPEDQGKSISVSVTGIQTGYVSKTRTSIGRVVLPGIQLPIADLAINGTLRLSSTVSASLLGPNYQYQWLRNGVSISGATSSTYTLSSSDVGRRISVKVTKVLPGYIPVFKIVSTSTLITK